MTKVNFLHCGNVLLAIANPLVRRAMTDEFRHRGVPEVIAVSDWDAMKEAIENHSFDVIVTDDVLGELQTGSLIRDIRNGVLHEHPFPLVLALAHQKVEQQLRELIDCGPDAVVLTPVSIADLFTKIDRLAAARKPFVITRNYIGPDRRTSLREGAAPPRFVEAPNPLAGGPAAAGFQDAIHNSIQALKTAKMECSLDQLAFALRAGDPAGFLELIPPIENLAKTTLKQALSDAAYALSAAIKSQVLADILDCSRKLLTAAQGKP